MTAPTRCRFAASHLRRFPFVVSLAAFLLGVPALRAQTTYSDNTFNNADWGALVMPCSTAGSTVIAVQDAAQGNPPSSRTITHHYQGGNPGIMVAHIRVGTLYNPATQGAIAWINYSYDLRHYTGPANLAVAFSPLIAQNGSYYAISPTDHIFVNAWQTFSGTNLTAASFHKICGLTTEHPDFSCAGGPMYFGFATFNSDPVPGRPFQDRTSGIDNWSITFVPTSSLSVEAHPRASMCAGDSVQLVGKGGNSYHWSPAVGLSCVDCPVTTARPPATMKYYLDGIDTNGCPGRDSVIITVLNPRAPVRTNIKVCIGDVAVLPCDASTQYKWAPSAGLSCDTCRNPFLRPVANALYTVTLRDANGCLTTDTVTITMQPKPVITLVDTVSICRGDSVPLPASGGVAYTWTPAAGLSCTNCARPLASPDSTTRYHLHMMDAAGCHADDSVLVVVRQPSAILVRIPRTLIAAVGQSLHIPVFLDGPLDTGMVDAFDLRIAYDPRVLRIDAVDAAGTLTAAWKLTGLDIDPVAGVSTAHFKATNGATLAGAGLLTQFVGTALSDKPDSTLLPVLIAFPRQHCLTAKFDPGLLRVSCLAAKVTAGPDTTFCAGGHAVLSAEGGVAYHWSPATGLSCADCPSPVAAPAATTTYTVDATDANGCHGTDTVHITVLPIRTPKRSDSAMCAGEKIVLPCEAGVSYRWAPSAGLDCDTCRNPVARPAASTLYTVTVDNGGGCLTVDTVNIIIHPLPPVKATGGTVICLGDSVALKATGGRVYRWSPTAGLSCSDCPSPVAAPLVTTTYVVDAIDAYGCRGVDSLRIVVSVPRAATRADVALCTGGSITLPCTAGLSYRWTPSTGLDCDTCRNPTVHPTASMVYTVVVNSGGTCIVVDTVGVTVFAPAKVVASDDVILCHGDSTVLSASGGGAYQWSPATGLSCTDCAAPTARPDVTTLYHVHMVDAHGCSADDSVLVEVTLPPTIIARIARDLFVRPGAVLRIPVLLDGQPTPGSVTQFDLRISYAPDLLSVDSVLVAGTLSNGWTITGMTSDRLAGHTDVHLMAPPGAWLNGPGVLLEFATTSYLGSADSSVLPLDFTAPTARCILLRAEPGLVGFDSLCGMSLRLIESIKGSYALDGNHPNPFNPTTTITFSLGLDGPTTLEVFNAVGRRVATLVNAHLDAGRYEVTWDATSQPSGVYYYRIRSGDWNRRASMVLMK